MNNRYVPNEIACPVPVDLLALLLRSNEVRSAQIVETLPMMKRAQLAAFCYSRCHMRSLGFRIAALCDERSLRLAAGIAGEILIDQSRSPQPFDVEPKTATKRAVTLARFAA